MKALSIKQPWTVLLAAGIKDIENRTWHTNYRGMVLLHASGKPYPNGWNALTNEQYRIVEEKRKNKELPPAFYSSAQKFCTIIGVAELVDCVKGHPSVWAEKDPDIWHWVFRNARLFANPIPGVPGKLGIWEYDLYDVNDRHCDECDMFCECGLVGHHGYDKACEDFCDESIKEFNNKINK